MKLKGRIYHNGAHPVFVEESVLHFTAYSGKAYHYQYIYVGCDWILCGRYGATFWNQYKGAVKTYKATIEVKDV